MAQYVYDGTYRNQILEVTKQVGGTTASGYPKDYDIKEGFSQSGVTYSTLTGSEFAQLSDADYETRRDAFYSYVAAQEDVTDDIYNNISTGFEATGTDHTNCPASVTIDDGDTSS